MNLKRYSDFEASTEVSEVPEVKLQNVEVKTEIETSITEEVLLPPKDSNLAIEILEENIIKFNTGNIKDILETIKTKYSTTDYYFRIKDNQLHVVKYNENLKLNINEFVNTLLKYYSTNLESRKITEGIKVKGNQNFSIVENMKTNYSNKFVDDLTKLLSKKNKQND
jgi:hypothetical protein